VEASRDGRRADVIKTADRPGVTGRHAARHAVLMQIENEPTGAYRCPDQFTID